MSTSSTTNPTLDLETEATTDEFGTNVGELIAEKVNLVPEAAETNLASTSRCNVGYTEQKIRIGVGTALLAAAAFAPVSRGWRIGLGVFGAAEILTGALRYCPVSQLVGVNTCSDGEQ